MFFSVLIIANGMIFAENKLEKICAEIDSDPDLKKVLFAADRNPFCKYYDARTNTFGTSKCEYDINVAYAYFKGQNPNLKITELTFDSKTALDQWMREQQGAYLIGYKPGCPPCANLLAAVQEFQKDSKKPVFMVNVHENDQAFNEDEDCWYYQGTPTAWKIVDGQVAKHFDNVPARSYFEEFIQE